MKLETLPIMQSLKVNEKQLAQIHNEIYGKSSSHSQISIQLQKLDKCITSNDRISHEIIDLFQ